jgi:hypothetical protein
LAIAATALTVGGFSALGGTSPAAYAVPSATPVYAFPVPGSKVAAPQTQITLRGVPTTDFGTITVTGSSSGAHSGTVKADSDGRGGSFLPNTPFTAGETVTVSTSLDIVGASAGSYQFTIADPAGAIPVNKKPPTPRVPGDVQRFHSRSDLAVPGVTQKRSGATGRGDVFIDPLLGRIQSGPMILDSSGNLIWFKRLPGQEDASDFQVQTYQHKPVLTWWQGEINAAGLGQGEGVINNAAYQQIATVKAANGLSADLHEFEITPQNTALLTANYPVYWNTTGVKGGNAHDVVLDSVVQEIDIPTGFVLFQWDSLDHVPITATYEQHPQATGHPFDYFHVNSIQQDHSGNLIVSARNTWAAYQVNHKTGAIQWTLGGKLSTFKMGKGAQFAFQHDVRVRNTADSKVTMFDDEAGPPKIAKQSRVLTLSVNFANKTASVAQQLFHNPALSANFEGNDDLEPGGFQMIGWGQQPWYTEYNSKGKVVLDGRIIGPDNSYRAYRYPWTGTPATAPAAAAAGGSSPTVWASWNGATSVAKWRVLGGSSSKSLHPLATAGRRGFETAIKLKSAVAYAEVQALNGSGHVLGTSSVVRSR